MSWFTLLTAPAAGRAPRINLMPSAEIERRQRAGLIRAWAWATVAALGVITVLSAAAFVVKFAADQRLAAEQARTSELLTELAALAPVASALSATTELTAFRAEAMGADIEWQSLAGSLAAVLPTGVSITGFDLVTGATVAHAEPELATGLAGTLTLTSATPIDMAATIRAVRGAAGVLTADGRDVTSASAGGAGAAYTYLLEVAFNQTLYTGDYTAEETER